MARSALALLGGTPVVTAPWPVTNTIGEEEKREVQDVLDSGILSGFRAVAGPDFYGGPKVRALEEAWAAYCGGRHAVAFNSLTSGLIAAIGAVGIAPGDEVIVSPFTMVASATCALAYGGIPVFADIDSDSYCLDPASVASRITPRTRAIVVVHQFGHPAAMDAVMNLAARHGLMVIEDCAQAPAGRYRGRPVGTFGQIGGFSLNFHKAIHSGEGGVMLTNDDELALRLRLIRNHGEVVVDALGVQNLINTVGGNTRMTELEAAVALAQLRKLDWLTETRVRLAAHLRARLSGLPGLTLQPALDETSRHVYYFFPMRYDATVLGMPRDLFTRAVQAEGVELRQAYVRPIYWEPLFQRRVAFGGGFPFSPPFYDGEVTYDRGLCPAAERAHTHELVFGSFCRWPLTEAHMDQVVQAFAKVIEHRADLMAMVQR